MIIPINKSREWSVIYYPVTSCNRTNLLKLLMNEEDNPDEKSGSREPLSNKAAAVEKESENISQSPVTDNDKQQPGTGESPEPDLPAATGDQTNPGQSISQPLTENMEIHHHPHVHHTKKWKSYLFEFLMLFLAIT